MPALIFVSWGWEWNQGSEHVEHTCFCSPLSYESAGRERLKSPFFFLSTE